MSRTYFLTFKGLALHIVRNHFTEGYKLASFYPETQAFGFLHSSSDSESDDSEGHTIVRGQVKSLAHIKIVANTKQILGRSAKMDLPLPDTTSK